MTRTLNISLNVPDSYGIEELTRQLTEYGERLISRRNRVQKSKKRRSQTFLKGLSMPAGTADKELIDAYTECKGEGQQFLLHGSSPFGTRAFA